MKILMLSARTGNGHNSVMESVYSYFNPAEHDIELFPSFYEDLMPSNQILSDFYNLLQVRSFEMCKLYTQMSTLKNTEGIQKTYNYWKEPLDQFFDQNPCDAIISTTPLINEYLIAWIKQTGKNIKFYIVVTDPFDPIYPGFAVEGADAYFVPNRTVKKLLLKNGLDETKIKVSGYPLHRKFVDSVERPFEILESGLYDENKKTLLINCGAQGSYHYISIIDGVYQNCKQKWNIVVICGKNKILYRLMKKKYEAIVLSYVEDIRSILEMSDLCITKAGANTFYECLYTQTPVLIDATKGLLYQEEGVVNFLKEESVGGMFFDLGELLVKVEDMLTDSSLAVFKENCKKLYITNGSETIVNSILDNGGAI